MLAICRLSLRQQTDIINFDSQFTTETSGELEPWKFP